MIQVAAVILSKDEHDLLINQIDMLIKYVEYVEVVVPAEESSLVKELTTLKGEYAASKTQHLLAIAPITCNVRENGFGELRERADRRIPDEYKWHLHVDVDELFDREFLINCHKIAESGDARCYRFPRVNMPNRKDYPDYQVRFFKYPGTEWVTPNPPWHETLFDREQYKPLDQISCKTLPYEIIHAPRSPNIHRPWWNEVFKEPAPPKKIADIRTDPVYTSWYSSATDTTTAVAWYPRHYGWM